MQKKDFPPDVIDMAVIATLKMLLRGKAVVWRDCCMDSMSGWTCINGQPVGDAVDGVLTWFDRYSTADPRGGNWFENANTIAFLKRRYL
jgi:hypothetical protein